MAVNLRTADLSNFTELSIDSKIALLNKKGLLLDTDVLDANLLHLYFVNGFFVEAIVDAIHNKVLEILPFKQGYSLNGFSRLHSN